MCTPFFYNTQYIINKKWNLLVNMKKGKKVKYKIYVLLVKGIWDQIIHVNYVENINVII